MTETDMDGSIEPAELLPVRMSDEGRTATWNPAVTRAIHVLVRVRRSDGSEESRRSVNSGRVRVRRDETIVGVLPVAD